MRDLAVIPPMLLDDRQKKLRFINNNGLLDDPKTINEETPSKSHYWTDTEKDVFLEKYLHRPKNFAHIASALHNKVQHCAHLLLQSYGYFFPYYLLCRLFYLGHCYLLPLSDLLCVRWDVKPYALTDWDIVIPVTDLPDRAHLHSTQKGDFDVNSRAISSFGR